MMRRIQVVLAVGLSSSLAVAGGLMGMSQTRVEAQAAALAQSGGSAEAGFTDTPVLPGLTYHVHDPARPRPVVVTPGAQPGQAPSDAIVLFDGKDLSKWSAAKFGTAAYTESDAPAPWKVENGYFEVVPGSGGIATRDKFGDVQVHVEWAAPTSRAGRSQNRGNSGLFLMGLYEVQILDNYENPTYADGTAGAIYGQWPPLVNPLRPAGAWQSYDVVFEAPRFDGPTLVKPAYLTVFINGVVVHNRQPSMGPMVWRNVAKYAPHPAEGPIGLQDHDHPVRYRNIWVRRLGGYDGKPLN
jgi:hypothetical protein